MSKCSSVRWAGFSMIQTLFHSICRWPYPLPKLYELNIGFVRWKFSVEEEEERQGGASGRPRTEVVVATHARPRCLAPRHSCSAHRLWIHCKYRHACVMYILVCWHPNDVCLCMPRDSNLLMTHVYQYQSTESTNECAQLNYASVCLHAFTVIVLNFFYCIDFSHWAFSHCADFFFHCADFSVVMQKPWSFSTFLDYSRLPSRLRAKWYASTPWKMCPKTVDIYIWLRKLLLGVVLLCKIWITNTHIHTYTHAQVYTHTNRERERETQIELLAHINTHTHIHRHRHTNTHANTHKHTYTHTLSYIYTHTYNYPHTNTHTTTHTNTHLLIHRRAHTYIKLVMPVPLHSYLWICCACISFAVSSCSNDFGRNERL